MIQLSARLATANPLAGRGIAPVARHRRTGGPSRGWSRSQASKRGEERVKQAAARIRNTVPGSSGRNSPATPTTRKTRPSANSRRRRIAANGRLRGAFPAGSAASRSCFSLSRPKLGRRALEPGRCAPIGVQRRRRFLPGPKAMSAADSQAPSSHDLDPTARPKWSARIRLRNYFLTGLDRRRPADDHDLHHLVVHHLGGRMGEAARSRRPICPKPTCRSRSRASG